MLLHIGIQIGEVKTGMPLNRQYSTT